MKLNKLICPAFVSILVASLLAVTQDKYSLKSPSGIAFADFRGYEDWAVVSSARTDEVLKSLRGDPAVCALHTTNGRWDIVAELQTDSLEAVDRVLGRIRQIDGISNTETSLLLSTHKC